MLGNIIVLLIVTAMLGGAIAKMINDKKKGVRCAGCPYSRECSEKNRCPGQNIICDLPADSEFRNVMKRA